MNAALNTKVANIDPAVAAYARMIEAGEHDDDGYTAATDELETAEATTIAGVAAKLHALKLWFEFIKSQTDGQWDQEIAPWGHIDEVFASVGRTLARLQAQ